MRRTLTWSLPSTDATDGPAAPDVASDSREGDSEEGEAEGAPAEVAAAAAAGGGGAEAEAAGSEAAAEVGIFGAGEGGSGEDRVEERSLESEAVALGVLEMRGEGGGARSHEAVGESICHGRKQAETNAAEREVWKEGGREEIELAAAQANSVLSDPQAAVQSGGYEISKLKEEGRKEGGEGDQYEGEAGAGKQAAAEVELVRAGEAYVLSGEDDAVFAAAVSAAAAAAEAAAIGEEELGARAREGVERSFVLRGVDALVSMNVVHMRELKAHLERVSAGRKGEVEADLGGEEAGKRLRELADTAIAQAKRWWSLPDEMRRK